MRKQSLFVVLARGLSLKGQVESIEGRPRDAAYTYLAIIRLGRDTGRGQVRSGWCSGQLIVAMGCERLRAVIEKLGAKDCRDLAADRGEVVRLVEEVLAPVVFPLAVQPELDIRGDEIVARALDLCLDLLSGEG